MTPPYVCLTIDTENPQTPLYEKRFRDNRIYADGNGVEPICNLLFRHHIRATFFLNVYEYVVWGRSVMRDIAVYIHDQGQDVELHTHPIWIDTARRENMFQYDRAEQTRIIQWGSDFIGKSVGRRPLCHRAGAYGFNADTLAACSTADIVLDSSQFFGHPFSRHIAALNEPYHLEGVLEVPVMGIIRPNNTMHKADLDSMGAKGVLAFVDAVMAEQKLNVITVMFHSYSLTRTTDNFRTFEPDTDKAAQLEALLLGLKARGCTVGSLADFADKINTTRIVST